MIEAGDCGRLISLGWSSLLLGVRRRARETMGELLAEDGEFLPIRTPADTWLYMPTKVAELDEDESDLTRFPTGRIMNVRRYVLKDPIPQARVFKVRQQPTGPLLASQSFVDAITATGLVGLRHLETGGRPVSERRATDSERAWAREGLCQAIRRLGAHPTTQISWLDTNGYSVLELALGISDVADHVDDLQKSGLLTSDQAAAVARIASLLEAIPGQVDDGQWTEGALRSSSAWAEIRVLASDLYKSMCPSLS